MPTYDWACDACGHQWEVSCAISLRNHHRHCPKCASEDTKRRFVAAPVLPWTPSAAESGRTHYRERLREGC